MNVAISLAPDMHIEIILRHAHRNNPEMGGGRKTTVRKNDESFLSQVTT